MESLDRAASSTDRRRVKRFQTPRILVILGITTAPFVGAAVFGASPAWAVSKLKCHTVAGSSAPGSKVQIGDCLGLPDTGGGGQAPNITGSTATITWESGDTTNFTGSGCLVGTSGCPKPKKGGKCPTGDQQSFYTGHVTGGNTPSIPNSSKVTDSLCGNESTGEFSLAPHYVFEISPPKPKK